MGLRVVFGKPAFRATQKEPRGVRRHQVGKTPGFPSQGQETEKWLPNTGQKYRQDERIHFAPGW